MKFFKSLVLILILITIMLFFYKNLENKEKSRILFNNCFNDEYLKNKAESYVGIKDFDFYKSMNKLEQALLDRHFLEKTDKQSYYNFIDSLNTKQKHVLKKVFDSVFSKKESNFLKDIIVSEKIKLCLRKKYFSSNNKQKQRIKKHFEFYNKFENGNNDYKNLLLSLINIYDNSFYKRKENRFIILYSIYDIY